MRFFKSSKIIFLTAEMDGTELVVTRGDAVTRGDKGGGGGCDEGVEGTPCSDIGITFKAANMAQIAIHLPS